MAKKKRELTPEEVEWEAGYDERTQRLRAAIERGHAKLAAERARQERRNRRPLLIRWLPFG